MHPTYDVLADHERRVADSLRAYDRRVRSRAQNDHRPRVRRSLLAWLAL
ncbi:hypothetical protein O4220_16035 [Rhodococcus ruber]|uniref:Uncharacterized protein n=1 Tax=Rhodococcus ruber TaxID=1830 RepID=A0ABT4MH60_9NOCA|nr:hypothetical protein [Rhodococcus ruber]